MFTAFTESGFVVERKNSKDQRRRKHGSNQLTKRYLKKDALPTIFPNAPSYLSSTPSES
jgi:hypothetical protein